MKYFFHKSAEAEFDNAISYYEGCRQGLGLDFAEEVFAAIERILQYPEAWSAMSKNTRRCLVNRFPFGIIYQVKPSVIYVIAIADLRRRPDYWLKRS